MMLIKEEIRRTAICIILVFLCGQAVASDGPRFSGEKTTGAVQSSLIKEASGIAASRKNARVLWSHNDSGDSPRVYAMTDDGAHLGVYNLDGASARDYEDIAIAPGPVDGQSYLYIGDIGDNGAKKPNITVYRVAEPAVDKNQSPVEVTLDGVDSIILQYPDGPRDAETLMVDPTTKDIYVVSKRDNLSRVYRAPYPQSTQSTTTMEYKCELSWNRAVGGDISPEGDSVIIKTTQKASLWKVESGSPLWQAFAGTEYSIPLVSERQGEAICFAANGRGYITISEGKHPFVNIFSEKAAHTSDSTSGEGEPPLRETKKPLVGAYYYPWYDASSKEHALTSGWTRKTMRAHLIPQQLPEQGIYSSQSAETIGAHIAQSKRGGIDFWVVSWWGPYGSKDTTFKNHILPHADSGKLKYALFYESTGRFGSFNRPSFRRMVSDFKYMSKNYFDNPNYLKIEGKPVVFIYLTRAYFRGRGHEELARLRKELPNLYLVGDDIYETGLPKDNYQPEYAQLWDAVTAYDVYGQSSKELGGTRAALKKLNATYANAHKIANSVGTGFIPAVSPGYNDKAVREGHPGRARYFKDVPGSREGDIFRAMIREVGLPNLDPRTGNMMMVNSFNEWYEDTQIEPTAGAAPSTTKDNSSSGSFYTEGDTYTDYGHLYLDILRQETKEVTARRR